MEPIQTNWAFLDDGGHGRTTLLCSPRERDVRKIMGERNLLICESNGDIGALTTKTQALGLVDERQWEGQGKDKGNGELSRYVHHSTTQVTVHSLLHHNSCPTDK